MLDEQGYYLDVNPAATLLTGYSREELLTMKFGDMSTTESLEEYFVEFRNLLENGIAKKEIKAIHKSGEIRWWSVEAVQLSENRFLGFSKDITERKKIRGNTATGKRQVCEDCRHFTRTNLFDASQQRRLFVLSVCQ